MFKLQEICSHVHIDYDGARYALARGILPPGIDPDPGRGRHRVFSQEQSLYLATALKLKEAGLTLPRIQEIVPWTRKIQEWSCNGGFEPNFAPLTGGLQTQHQWFLDIGDGRYVRLRTDANPSKRGIEATPWTNTTSRQGAPDAKPLVIISLDIGEISRLLDSPDAANSPVAR
jgi:DNA-binding transcriptional MerR regulator